MTKIKTTPKTIKSNNFSNFQYRRPKLSTTMQEKSKKIYLTTQSPRYPYHKSHHVTVFNAHFKDRPSLVDEKWNMKPKNLRSSSHHIVKFSNFELIFPYRFQSASLRRKYINQFFYYSRENLSIKAFANKHNVVKISKIMKGHIQKLHDLSIKRPKQIPHKIRRPSKIIHMVTSRPTATARNTIEKPHLFYNLAQSNAPMIIVPIGRKIISRKIGYERYRPRHVRKKRQTYCEQLTEDDSLPQSGERIVRCDGYCNHNGDCVCPKSQIIDPIDWKSCNPNKGKCLTLNHLQIGYQPILMNMIFPPNSLIRNRQTCWYIKSLPGFKIYVMIKYLNTESYHYDSCLYDYLTISNNNLSNNNNSFITSINFNRMNSYKFFVLKLRNSSLRFCGKYRRIRVESDQPIFIRYTSDQFIKSVGFKLFIDISCFNVRLTGEINTWKRMIYDSQIHRKHVRRTPHCIWRLFQRESQSNCLLIEWVNLRLRKVIENNSTKEYFSNNCDLGKNLTLVLTTENITIIWCVPDQKDNPNRINEAIHHQKYLKSDARKFDEEIQTNIDYYQNRSINYLTRLLEKNLKFISYSNILFTNHRLLLKTKEDIGTLKLIHPIHKSDDRHFSFVFFYKSINC
ncbi:hypothetical protein SNEBB_006348 [Seison nebaliae]|nr:hypothetical protein SNEBB_006348 [Seison nebaliae]